MFTYEDGTVSLKDARYDNGSPAGGGGYDYLPPGTYEPAAPLGVVELSPTVLPVLIDGGTSAPQAPTSSGGGGGIVAGAPKPPDADQPVQATPAGVIPVTVPMPVLVDGAPAPGATGAAGAAGAGGAAAAPGGAQEAAAEPGKAPAWLRPAIIGLAVASGLFVLFLALRDDKGRS